MSSERPTVPAGDGNDVDLAARLLGATVIAASDEAFGEKENLLNPHPVTFEPGHYGPRGEIVDGWETRRRRSPGHDWVIVRLGVPGRISAIDVDTTSFTGNFPPSARVEACAIDGYPGVREVTGPSVEWYEIVPRSPLEGDHHNLLPVAATQRFTHVRLSAFPDGGVARLRVLGGPLPDPREVDDLTVDLASQRLGGRVVESSDGYFGSAVTLNRPDEARTMGEGWETRRRRDDGHDHVVIRLGYAGIVRQLVVDTRHFRYNASSAVSVWAHGPGHRPAVGADSWMPLLPMTSLQPDTRHVFRVQAEAPAEWVRLDAFPDGGLARFRVIGVVDAPARRRAGYRWFNALPPGQAADCLAGCGLDRRTAGDVVRARPLDEAWLTAQGRGLAPDVVEVLRRVLEGGR